MLKMVFKRFRFLYFVSLIMFMDGLYLDNDFRTRFRSFYYFYYCCCFLSCHFVALFCFIFIIMMMMMMMMMIIIYSLNLFLFFAAIMLGIFFVKILGSPIIYFRDVCIPVYVTFCNFSIALFIALSWILFSYLLTFSLIKFPYSITVMTFLLQISL